jgi:hypothetical protein
MALYVVSTGKVTLTAAATKSLILLNPPAQEVTLRKITISLDGSSAAAGVQFDLYRVSTLGTPAGTTATPALTDERDVASQSSALTALTTEPTAVTVIDSVYLQPLGGLLPDWQPFGAEPMIKGGGNRLGLRYVTPASVSPDCLASFWFDE